MDAATNAIIRELCNGAWSVSSIVMILVLGHYLYCKCRERKRCWQKIEVQAAGVLFLLVFGHVFRSFFAWWEWVYNSIHVDPGIWGAWQPFVIGTIFILLAKGACVYMFTYASHKRAWEIVEVGAFLTVTIPLVVYFLF